MSLACAGCGAAPPDAPASSRANPSTTTAPDDQWAAYAGPAGARYSTLDRLTPATVGRLAVAWTYHTGERGQNARDADNLRARLALLGVEARIQTATLPDKGVWHRVRVGPYTSVEELGRTRDALKQNGVETTLIKVRE